MSNDISLVEITGEISAGYNGADTFFTPQNGKGVTFTVFHKAEHGWGPISVTTYHRDDIAMIKEYPPSPGARVTIIGSLKYMKNSRNWKIIIPDDRRGNGGMNVNKRPLMLGLQEAINEGKKEYAA